MTYEQAKAVRRGIRNPWLTEALDRLAAFGERGQWRPQFILTVGEYADSHTYHPPGACGEPGCFGTAYWKASVGAYKCAACNTSGGRVIE